MQVRPLIIGEIGSVAHGLGVEESDHDYQGLYIDPPDILIGLDQPDESFRDRDKPEGVKSEAGDSETVFYSLRKYARMAAQGNPTVMTLLYTPVLTHPDEIGIQRVRDMFLSKRLVNRHTGYADSMYAQISGAKPPRTNRPALIAKHGFDTKASFHAIRLLMQGYEMLIHRTITMPMHDLAREFLLDLRNGLVSQERTLEEIRFWRHAIVEAGRHTNLPDHPDYDRINNWLIGVHKIRWEFVPYVTYTGGSVLSHV